MLYDPDHHVCCHRIYRLLPKMWVAQGREKGRRGDKEKRSRRAISPLCWDGWTSLVTHLKWLEWGTQLRWPSEADSLQLPVMISNTVRRGEKPTRTRLLERHTVSAWSKVSHGVTRSSSMLSTACHGDGSVYDNDNDNDVMYWDLWAISERRQLVGSHELCIISQSEIPALASRRSHSISDCKILYALFVQLYYTHCSSRISDDYLCGRSSQVQESVVQTVATVNLKNHFIFLVLL